MVYSGHVRHGSVVLDQPVVLPEGLEVRVEVSETANYPSQPRPAGTWAEVEAIRMRLSSSDRRFGDSAELLREDRQR
jgi:hypothetical protein